MLWIGLIPMLIGAVVELIALGVIPGAEPADSSAIMGGVLFGLMFFSVGVFVSLADERFTVFHESWWFKLVLYLSMFTFTSIFILMFNWVSFGPGEREFSISISIPFMSVFTDNTNALLGRILFAIPTLIMDFFAIAVIFIALKETVKDWIIPGDEE